MTILTADELPAGDEIRTTVGVVGGGAAGIAVALRLDERGVDCVVCESGADDYDQRTQDLYAGESNGYYDLTSTRLRQFGGSTNHFAGQSRPLGVVDFGEASWRPGASWPITHDEFASYLPAAADLLGMVPPPSGTVGDGGDPLAGWAAAAFFDPSQLADLNPPAVVGPDDPQLVHDLFQMYPVSMAVTHRQRLAGSARATVVFGVNAVEVVLADGGEAVERVVLATLGGRRLNLVADAYVLATGGIESPRLLLASVGRSPDGVGNRSGLVGRYFADHPRSRGLVLVGAPPVSPLSPSRREPGPNSDRLITTHLSISDDTQLRSGLPGFHAHLMAGPSPLPEDETIDAVAALVAPSVPTPDDTAYVSLHFDAVPNRESRVTLGEARNELGERTAVVDWRLTDDDEAAMAAIAEVVSRRLAVLGAGRMDTRPPGGSWRDSVKGQHHHMGTLRMSSSPSEGVVDADLRFHDVPNLYAAGSSVFPTFGHVNPTLNLVALSLRLADHLADEVGS